MSGLPGATSRAAASPGGRRRGERAPRVLPAGAMAACLAELGDVHALLSAYGLTDEDEAALRTAFGV